jgi:hypothetical protein
MSPVRLVFLMTACTALAAPLASHSAPTTASVAGDCSARMTLTERRVGEHAGAGMPALISYVHLTQPIYQITVDEAVAMVDAQRARQAQCAVASAR